MADSSTERQTTLYSMVAGLAGGEEDRRSYLDRFVALYGEPLKLYLVTNMRLDDDVAHDILQDFLVKKLLDPGNQLASRFLEMRARQKGPSFRWYLLRSLRNYAIDKLRLKRREKDMFPIPEAYDPQDRTVQAFETDWARNLMSTALREMEASCSKHDVQEQWAVFHARIVQPAVEGKKPSFSELAASLGSNPRTIQRRLTAAKQRFRGILRQLIADYLPYVGRDGGELFLAELADLIDAVASAKLLHVSVEESGSLSLFEFAESGHDEEYSSRDCRDLWEAVSASTLRDVAIEFEFQSIDFAVLEKSGLTTVGQLWDFPSPPMSLLQSIKEFAKRVGRRRGSAADAAYPLPICLTLYQLAIATAWQRYDRTRLSSSKPSVLLKRLPMVLGYDWLDDQAKALLEGWRDDLVKYSSDSE